MYPLNFIYILVFGNKALTFWTEFVHDVWKVDSLYSRFSLETKLLAILFSQSLILYIWSLSTLRESNVVKSFYKMYGSFQANINTNKVSMSS